MKLLRRLLFVVLALGGTFAVFAQNLEPAPANKPADKPLDPALVAVADLPGLPRVLLIGDSISMGYTLPVRAALAGRANVHRPAQNCGDTARGLVNLTKWLGAGPWDVIHFNFGLHDLKYLNAQGKYVPPEQGKQVASPEVYRERLREFTLRLRATAPDAKLVFATTTPVPEGTTGRVAGDEARYNAVAIALLRELGVTVNDLGDFVREEQRKLPPRPLSQKPPGGKQLPAREGELQLPFNVHFTAAGYAALAAESVKAIQPLLPPPTPLP